MSSSVSSCISYNILTNRIISTCVRIIDVLRCWFGYTVSIHFLKHTCTFLTYILYHLPHVQEDDLMDIYPLRMVQDSVNDIITIISNITSNIISNTKSNIPQRQHSYQMEYLSPINQNRVILIPRLYYCLTILTIVALISEGAFKSLSP